MINAVRRGDLGFSSFNYSFGNDGWSAQNPAIRAQRSGAGGC